MKVEARIYHLGGEIGVCEILHDGMMYVAECSITGGIPSTVTVLPQSVRTVSAFWSQEVELRDAPTMQDLVDRAAHGLERFRQRLTFDPKWADDTEVSRLLEQARGAYAELGELIAILDRPDPLPQDYSETAQ